MLTRALAALLGCLAALLYPGPWPVAAGIAACVAAGAVLAAWRGAGVLAAFLVVALLAERQVLELLALQVTQAERVVAEVEVDTLPQPAGAGLQFDGWMRLPRRAHEPSRRVRIQWPAAAARGLRAGETWQLALNLRPALPRLNPGAVDDRRLLWRDHVSVRASVLASPLDRRLAPARGLLLPLRERIANGILARVADPAAAALLAALAVGYTGDVETRQWRFYNLTGITHLIAISGMHVTLFAVGVMSALRALWARCARLALRVRRDTFAACGGVLAATAYALVAGFSVPTQRTLLMLLAAVAWRERARASTPGCALGAAVLLLLVTDPCAVLAAGFWLSCGAVGIILWREAARLRPPADWRAALKLQFAITGALAPATFGQFGSVPIAGLWINPIAIPWFSLLLVPLALAASALLLTDFTSVLATPVLAVAGLLTTPLLVLLASAASVPWALWSVQPPLAWYPVGGVAVLLLVLPVAARLRALVACLALLPLLCPPESPEPGEARVLTLATGTAPIAIVRTRTHALLFGTGDARGTAGARVTSVALPAAAWLGVSRWDLAIAGGLDRDVAAGLGVLAARMPAMRVAGGATTAGEWPPDVVDCASLGRWKWDGVQFEVRAAERGRGCMLRVETRAAAWQIAPRLAATATLPIAQLWTAGLRGPPLREAATRPWGAWNGDLVREEH